MTKSIKLENGTYWDSKGIVHNRRLLSEELGSLNNKANVFNENIANLNRKIGDIKYYRQPFGTSLTFYTQHSGHALIIAGGIAFVIILYNPPGEIFNVDLYKSGEYTLTRDEADFQKVTINLQGNMVITAICF